MWCDWVGFPHLVFNNLSMDRKQLDLIADISKKMANYIGWDQIDIMMDLTYCIEGGCDLRLKEMCQADEMSLLHDIYGINSHLNHDTYQLEGGFLPRYAGKDED